MSGLTYVLARIPPLHYLGAVRYYMHISDQSGFIEDEEGRDLADDASAREEAIVAARDVMVADLRTGHLDLTLFIEVEDADHNLLFTVQFGDVVTVTRA